MREAEKDPSGSPYQIGPAPAGAKPAKIQFVTG